MLEVEEIEDWLGRDVLDADGEQIGKLDEVFYSAGSGEAAFASVKSGLLGRRISVVPLANATVARDHVRLPYVAEQVQRAGGEVAVHDTLDAEQAGQLGELYGVEIHADDVYESASAARRRREAAAAAAGDADQLERDAERRAEEERSARDAALSAEQDAADKGEAARRARAAAEHARAEADRLASDARHR